MNSPTQAMRRMAKKEHSGNSRHRMGMGILCAAAAFCLSCQSPFFDSPEETLEKIQEDIDRQDYAAAREKLDLARIQAKQQSMDTIAYNAALISILSGDCKQAEELLTKILDNFETTDEREHANAYPLDAKAPGTLFHARVHQALGLALVCPTHPFASPSDEQFRKALQNDYTANTLGLDVRPEVTQIIQRWIPDCESFVPSWQKSADNPENALTIKDIRAPEFVVCPDGVWIRVDARKHEKVRASFYMTPLNRKVYIDDSQKLPFSRLHADILAAPSDEHAFDEPVQFFLQPLPTGLPTEADYAAASYDFPDYTFTKSGIYYYHLYTENNGEARVHFTYHRIADCEHIDDLISYTEDLSPKNVWLMNGKTLQDMTLCPERPDNFQFTLEAKQYALITINKHDESLFSDHAPHVEVFDSQKRNVPTLSFENIHSLRNQSVFIPFLRKQKTTGKAVDSRYPMIILVHNNAGGEETFQLRIRQNSEWESSLHYDISYASSIDCSQKQPARTIPIDLSFIMHSKYYILPPVWLCPNQNIYLQPILPDNQTLLRTTMISHIFSDIPLHDDDFHFSSLLRMEADNRDYPVENSRRDVSQWIPGEFSANYALYNPITADTSLKLATGSGFQGFANLVIQIESQKQSDSDDSKPQEQDNAQKENSQDSPNENAKKDKNKKDKDSAQGTPDKPSHEKTDAMTSGNDGAGDRSTPSADANNRNAAQFDPRQLEKDYLDALLDDIERGYFYIPIPGNDAAQDGGKPW